MLSTEFPATIRQMILSIVPLRAGGPRTAAASVSPSSSPPAGPQRMPSNSPAAGGNPAMVVRYPRPLARAKEPSADTCADQRAALASETRRNSDIALASTPERPGSRPQSASWHPEAESTCRGPGVVAGEGSRIAAAYRAGGRPDEDADRHRHAARHRPPARPAARGGAPRQGPGEPRAPNPNRIVSRGRLQTRTPNSTSNASAGSPALAHPAALPMENTDQWPDRRSRRTRST